MAGRLNARAWWLAVVGLTLLLGGFYFLRPREAVPPLACAPEAVRRDGDGVAFCALDGQGRALSAGQALTLNRKLDLNAASVDDLKLLQGIGPTLAQAIVDARSRLGGFRNWEDVDGVAGVGPAKLSTLQEHTEIR